MATHAASRLSSIDHHAVTGDRAHRGRRRLKGLLLLAAAAALCALWAPSAQAGTYRVAQCTSGNQAAPDYVYAEYGGGSGRFNSSNTCGSAGGSLYIGSKLDGLPMSYPGGAKWSFVAPPGTTITQIDVNAALNLNVTWIEPFLNVDGARLDPFMPWNYTGGWQSWSWSGSAQTFDGSDGCESPNPPPNHCVSSGTNGQDFMQMADMNTRLSDTSAPTATPASAGLFAPGSRAGTHDATVTGSDSLGGGIQELSITVNGTSADTQDYSSSSCQLLPDGLRAKRPRACNVSEVKTWSLNTASAPFHEGTNTVVVCSEDYAENRSGNRTCTTRSVVVDNVAPNTTITSGPADNSTVPDQTVIFDFSSTEAGTFQCQREQRNDATAQFVVVEPYAPCSRPKSYTLEKGTYRFCVRAVDQATPPNIDPSPACRTFTVDPPSDRCNLDSAIYDGYAGTTYVKLRAQRGVEFDPTATAICLRLDNRQGVAFGGAFVVDDPSAGPAGPPRLDSNGAACNQAGGGAAYVNDGTIGNPGDPAYARYIIEQWAVPGETWICVRVEGTVPYSQRVIVPLPGDSVSVPTFTADPPSVVSPAPSPPVTGYPSARCEQTSGGTKQPIVNGDTPAGHVYAYERHTANTAALCVRLDGGAVIIGGELKVDASGSLVPPVIGTDTNTAPCTSNVISVGPPADVKITRSPGTSPASICFEQGLTKVRIWVDPQGTGTAIVGFTPDPDIGL